MELWTAIVQDALSKSTLLRALIQVLVWSTMVHDDAFLRSGSYSYSKGFEQQTCHDLSGRSNAFFIYKSPPTNEEPSRESTGSASVSFSKPTLAMFVASVISYVLIW
eukprot:gene9883-10930_t